MTFEEQVKAAYALKQQNTLPGKGWSDYMAAALEPTAPVPVPVAPPEGVSPEDPRIEKLEAEIQQLEHPNQ